MTKQFNASGATLAKPNQITIGAVSYLNTKPLVHRISDFLPDCRVVYDLPSRLADQLKSGELDIALIPSVEYFLNSGYQIVSDACIACRGPVLSVKLLSRRPLADIRRLALDEGSRTSAALTRILLKQVHGVVPDLEPLPIGSDFRDIDADAVLLIGDRAIDPPAEAFSVEIDLGEFWTQWAQLPFVFAMWVGRMGVDFSGVARGLEQSRDEGLVDLESLANEHCASVGLTPEGCLGYLRDNLYFRFGEDERRGMELYFRHVAEFESALATEG